MSLPFLKKKHQTGVMVTHRKPDESAQSDEQHENENHAMQACADDLIRAIHAQDSKGVADALCAAFEIYESEPHSESNNYDAQNQKAAGQERE